MAQAESKKAFVLYNDYENVFEMLTDEEAGKLVKHLFAYVNNKDSELEDRLLKLTFEPIRLQLNRDIQKYELIRQEKVKAGKKGGLKSGENRRKPKQNEANEADASFLKQNEANEAVTVTDTDTDTDTLSIEGAHDWKKSFDEYKDQVRKAFIKVTQDNTWMQKQQEYYPNINIKKSIEKACVNYWATEAGWKNKKNKRTKTIDWKTTFGNALAMKENHVYNEKNSFNNEKNAASIIEI